MKCVSCNKLGKCKRAFDAGPLEIVRGFGCPEHERADGAVIAARTRAVNEMGMSAVDVFLDTPVQRRRCCG